MVYTGFCFIQGTVYTGFTVLPFKHYRLWWNRKYIETPKRHRTPTQVSSK
jgi:hypothetical protein